MSSQSHVVHYAPGHTSPTHNASFTQVAQDLTPLTVVVLGASGDLAKKKTYPALFGLYLRNLLPKNTIIYGYARSHMELNDFKKRISSYLKGDESKKQEFLSMCFYHSGKYDEKASYDQFSEILKKSEEKWNSTSVNRLFYMAIPPSIFLEVSKGIHDSLILKSGGWSRIVVEKPFGKDLDSSRHLVTSLKKLFMEKDLFRIDHYLGKEMVQNLMVLRFANSVFEPLWNKQHISSITITFKENIGTEGRGGYFDEFGIIRDVMQNHLMQVLSLVAMEPPVSMSADDITNEKVRLLRCIQPVRLDETVFGQYLGNDKIPGYLDDEGVPKDSITPTYAAAVFWVNNPRWRGMPFILKCGKALDERKTEVRIQFKAPENFLFKDQDITRNELVMRIQPGEAVYLKLLTKKPGLENTIEQTELDLSYKNRFENLDLPDAYERLILDSIKGDHNLFVRDDELDIAWQIFTPLLEQMEKRHLKPEPYEFGSRGPKSADELSKRFGFQRSTGYKWPGTSK
ncbi:glucose 6-phosphate-1-dehydrogenase [Tieghemostelium lacteum]|uniref:Glucose-6-phosphate 1-dehydrogenase n=1 Tax=Tieghemostelium lacteum TaxID=361077 RepID=A0A152A725_TIELA|nr:glucose 6-phosphate-1-dehydrogenase [Tieghemostelium lacteum]|eukprot:KYR02029.1 glucose 6-phosphate-1-dehydrogenase [Tieghemostelium lacteum]